MTDREGDKEDWAVVPKASKKIKNRNEGKPTNPYIEVLSPSNTNIEIPQHYEPFMILLVGLPGSGKSTFAQTLVASMPNKFCRINQDELKTRVKCEKKLKSILSGSEQPPCPIIDRCNFDAKQRSTWYRLAKIPDVDDSSTKPREKSKGTIETSFQALDIASKSRNIPVDVVVLDLPFQECLRRCQSRRGHETIKSPKEAEVVLKQLRRQWSPPHFAKNALNEKSSYRSLTIVRTERERKDCLQRFLDQTH